MRARGLFSRKHVPDTCCRPSSGLFARRLGWIRGRSLGIILENSLPTSGHVAGYQRFSHFDVIAWISFFLCPYRLITLCTFYFPIMCSLPLNVSHVLILIISNYNTIIIIKIYNSNIIIIIIIILKYNIEYIYANNNNLFLSIKIIISFY